MPSPVFNVTLLVPGIGRLAPASALQWSDGHSLQPWQSQLCDFLGQTQWNGQQLPVAELLWRGQRGRDHETGEKMSAPPVCADPVHLRADRDTARLVPASMLDLSEEDADSLLSSINAFLQADNLQLHRGNTRQWFITGLDGSTLLSYPPGFLAQRNASAYLPEGVGADQWKRLMTEVQMLLHTHPVNSERERRGLMPVNSLWFWGGARLASTPQAEPGAPPRVRVHADEAFVLAMGEHLGLDCQPLATFDPASLPSDVLIVDTRLEQALQARNESAVNQALQDILGGWVNRLQERLKQGEDVRVMLFDEDGIQGRLDADTMVARAAADSVDDSRLRRAVLRLRARAVAGWQWLKAQRR